MTDTRTQTTEIVELLRGPYPPGPPKHILLKAADVIEHLRCSVIAFGAPWAVQYASDHGLPKGHIHPTHYDILKRAGARMDDFTRATIGSDNAEGRQAQMDSWI